MNAFLSVLKVVGLLFKVDIHEIVVSPFVLCFLIQELE